jgi:hypothetical protein
MYCQIIKFEAKEGENIELALKKYIKAASYNPGFIHGSYFRPDALPDGGTPPGFEIGARERTWFVQLIFRTPRDMLKHVEFYHGDDLNLLPSPHDYVLGKYVDDDDVEIEDRYAS